MEVSIAQKCLYCNNKRNTPYQPYDWVCDDCSKQLNEKGFLLINDGKARVIKTEKGGIIYMPLGVNL